MDREDDMDDHSDAMTSPASPSTSRDPFRKRSSRACDQCRKAKSRCDPSQDDGPCKSCQLSGTACTYQGPSQKRGPPKGYLQALETRLHEAEALLGAIISSPQAENLVAVLAKDPLAEKIITRVNKSVFGALGRPQNTKAQPTASRGRRRPDKEQQRMSNGQAVYSRENGSPVFTSPSYAWQDHLNEQLASEGAVSNPTLCNPSVSDSAAPTPNRASAAPQWDSSRRQRRRTEISESLRLDLPANSQPSLYSSVSSEMHSEPDTSSDFGLGRLSLDGYQQVRYHDEASGLPLLGQSPRTDALYHQQIWRLPQMYTYQSRPGGRSVTMPYDDLEREVPLPPRAVQEHLLRQYFHYVHPILLIVNGDDFWDEWTSMHKYASGGPSKLLLLAMFALAARYMDPESPEQSNQHLATAGNEYMEAAKSLLGQVYMSSRLSTCQALLLMGYRAIGLSGLTDAALFIAIAIQIAQDLGLNRHADQWARDGSGIFSERRLRLQRSVWYGCVVLDSYVAAQLGRPLRIRREDYDTRLPEVDSQEDFQLWMPYRNAPASQGYNPLPGRITSCFRALCSLAQIFSTILQRLYSVNSGRTLSQKQADSFEIDQKLQHWYMELPESLRFTASPVPPPQILCLHMFYWCGVLLLHRTFIHLHSRDSQLPFRRALDLGASAATNLTNIVHTYNAAFGLRHCPALLTYYLMTAGVMHIATLHVHPSDIQAKLGLQRCLRNLDDMKDIWPAASQVYTLLSGADVVKKESSPLLSARNQSRKRGLDELSNGSTDHRSSRSDSEPSSANMTSFMELTHSLGLDPSGLDRVFDMPYTTWPSGEGAFQGMQPEMQPQVLPGSGMLLRDK